jgi:hypothetical protein
MKALLELEQAGYRFDLNSEGGIHYAHYGAELSDGAWVRSLLAEIQTKRQEVTAILADREARRKDNELFTNHTRCCVVFPADTRLPFPAGRWRRLDDGGIEAYLNYIELQEMRLWRDEILP